MAFSLEEVCDRLEINEMYARYVHAADERDTESLNRVFLPHTMFDWTACGGAKMTYEEAKQGPVFTGKLFPWSFHIYTNPLVDFSDDRRGATVKVKAVNPSGLHDDRDEPIMFQTQGTYVDTLEKTINGWRITNRVWKEFFILGPLKKVDGIPGMLKVAGRSLDS
jgi:hypothetical protein